MTAFLEVNSKHKIRNLGFNRTSIMRLVTNEETFLPLLAFLQVMIEQLHEEFFWNRANPLLVEQIVGKLSFDGKEVSSSL